MPGVHREKTMGDRARETVVIDAPPQACFDVICDFLAYPEWASDIKSVEVDRVDDDDRGGLVSFRAAAMGRSTNYQLEYFYGSNPKRVGWRLVDGDLLKRLDGHYVFSELDGDRTEVLYELDAELVVPMTGFVKRRAESRIIRTALEDLRQRVEAGVRD